MPYRFVEDVAIADVAFEAWGDTLEALFGAAAGATLNVMVNELDTVVPRVRRSVSIRQDDLEMALFDFLQEVIFYKDAERLLLRAEAVEVRQEGDGYGVSAELVGEELDMARHELVVDVKAVTLHRFRVGRSERGWEAFVILDI